jgi:hypothetical protein
VKWGNWGTDTVSAILYAKHYYWPIKATDTPTVINQGRPFSTVEQIGLGVDLSLPLIKTNVRARCDLDPTTGPGQWITAGSWALQVLSWVAATLVIAGYTGVVRRT